MEVGPRKFRRRDDVVMREMGGSAVLVQLETNRIYELNATGLRIWSMLEEGLARDEICTRLKEEFGSTTEVPQAVDELLAELVRENLICE